MLLSLSIIVKSLSSAFGCFVEMWFLMALVVLFLWSETFFKGPVGFTYVLCCTVGGWAFPVVDSCIPHQRGVPSLLGLSTQKTINTSHLLDLYLQ